MLLFGNGVQRPGLPDPVVKPTQPLRSRPVIFDGREHDTALYRRETLALGDRVSGPAIIEEETATTLVPPGWSIEVIAGGHMSLSRRGGK